MSDQQPACPICGVEFETWNSVKGHITRKTDSEHKGLSGPDVINGDQEIDDVADPEPEEDDQDGPDDTPDDGGGSDGLEFPEAETDDGNGDDDCDHPDAYDVGAGTTFTTEDGEQGVTEEGDQYCPDCGGLVEPDGTVIH